jgi:hypothetical protein
MLNNLTWKWTGVRIATAIADQGRFGWSVPGQGAVRRRGHGGGLYLEWVRASG